MIFTKAAVMGAGLILMLATLAAPFGALSPRPAHAFTSDLLQCINNCKQSNNPGPCVADCMTRFVATIFGVEGMLSCQPYNSQINACTSILQHWYQEVNLEEVNQKCGDVCKKDPNGQSCLACTNPFKAAAIEKAKNKTKQCYLSAVPEGSECYVAIVQQLQNW